MVANAIGRCEFRTFREHKEIREAQYYRWNIEPNPNQNSSAFLHKLVTRLFLDNEVLIVDPGDLAGGARGALAVADDWTVSDPHPVKPNVYSDIVIDDMSFKRKLREDEVLHLTLHHADMRPVIGRMAANFEKLAGAALSDEEWRRGKHLKVHVDQITQGEDGWETKFTDDLQKRISPFLKNPASILPEFDGYTYSLMEAGGSGDTRDIKELCEDIFEYTARGFLIPAVLVNGKVEATADAQTRFLTWCVDPICDQLQEEILRKRYGYEEWQRGNYIRVDSSAVNHFDIFENAPQVEKLVGSGAYTVNDVLRAANQPAIDESWANEHFLTRNIAKMDEVAANLDA